MTVRCLVPVFAQVFVILQSVLFEVTRFQLEKMYGKGKEAKAFLDEVLKGALTAHMKCHTRFCIWMK